MPKPIALYFSMNEENEAVYDNILKRVYRNRFDSNPSGPTIEEMFVADAERVSTIQYVATVVTQVQARSGSA